MIPLALFLLGCALIYLGTLESAFSATLRLPFRVLAERDDGSRHLQHYLEDPVRLLAPTRLLWSLVVALATIACVASWQALTWRALGGVLLTVTGLIAICGQVVPLLLVRRDPERVLELLLPSFHPMARALRPAVAPLLRVGIRGERRGAGNGEEAPALDPGERADAEQEQAAGLIEGDERRLLRSIVDFGGTLVKEVMTPRPDVVAVQSSATLDELWALARDEQYSRMPVFGESLDEIVGIVFVKDLIQRWERDAPDGPSGRVVGLMRPATFVPETKRVAELLREFQLDHVQMAIVVDEYGGTAGLVTLEDLIEEIVGEIRDEYDGEETPSIVEEPQGALVVSGMADVDELAKRLDVRIEREGFETVGGYLLACLGRVPLAGESFEVDGLSVEVLEAEGRRVRRVRVRRLAGPTASAS